MDLKDSPAEAEFRHQIQAWLAETVPTLGGPEPHRLEDKRDYWGGRWQRLLFDAGYAGLSWPSEFGGGGGRCQDQGGLHRGDGPRRRARAAQHHR